MPQPPPHHGRSRAEFRRRLALRRNQRTMRPFALRRRQSGPLFGRFAQQIAAAVAAFRPRHLRRVAVLGPWLLICILAVGWVAQPAPLASQSGLTFVAAPRISKATFTSVLRRGTGGGPSPAAPFGDELYDIIVSYNLDPAVALAFFAHESQLCTVGVCADQNTRGWGAMRRPVRAGRSTGFAPGRVGTFAVYVSWQESVRDWCELMLGRYVARGLDTVEAAVPVYAPRSDGNVPESYIRAIYRYVGGWQGLQPGELVADTQVEKRYDGPLDEALIIETFLSSGIEYHPEWAFHSFMLEEARAGRPLGAPLGDSSTITVGSQKFAIQVFAFDTLYTPLAADLQQTDWSDVRRMSELMRGNDPDFALIPTPTLTPTRPPQVSGPRDPTPTPATP